jgi:hypothetical protein
MAHRPATSAAKPSRSGRAPRRQRSTRTRYGERDEHRDRAFDGGYPASASRVVSRRATAQKYRTPASAAMRTAMGDDKSSAASARRADCNRPTARRPRRTATGGQSRSESRSACRNGRCAWRRRCRSRVPASRHGRVKGLRCGSQRVNAGTAQGSQAQVAPT